MLAIVQKDWLSMAPDRQIAMLRKLKPEMLCSFVRRLNPQLIDVSVLRWIAASQDIDLSTAITLFFAFNPGELNAVSRDAFPQAHRERASVIDVLCQRINCGFYIPIASRRLDDPAQLKDWLKRQEDNVARDRPMQWRLSAAIVAPILSERSKTAAYGRASQRQGMIQGLFSPLFVANRT